MKVKEKLSAVRAEIKMRKETLKPHGGQGLVVTRLMRELCDDFLSFIDSIPEDPQVKESEETQHVKEMCKENGNSLTQEPVSEDLEEAAEMFIDSFIPTEVDTVTPFAAEYVIGLLNKAIEFGANWQKEQLMTKAFDVTIAIPYPRLNGYYTQLVDSKEALPFGDNIKVLVIKED